MFSSSQLSCSECQRLIDVGDPFLASATYPARSALQAESVNVDFLQQSGEVLCAICATKRLGAESLARLKGAVFAIPKPSKPEVTKRSR